LIEGWLETLGRGRRGKIGARLVGASLAAILAVSLAACGSSLSNVVRNPFKKEEEKLPGDRIAVITDPTLVNLDPASMKPVSVPPPRVNAAWSQPGGSPSNNLGHLALGDSLHKVWGANACTGSSSR
jgi:hypothetical protein